METREVIDTMIDKIIDGNNVGAQEDFYTAIADKINTVIGLKKQEIAASIYGLENTESETSEEEISDENV